MLIIKKEVITSWMASAFRRMGQDCSKFEGYFQTALSYRVDKTVIVVIWTRITPHAPMFKSWMPVGVGKD